MTYIHKYIWFYYKILIFTKYSLRIIDYLMCKICLIDLGSMLRVQSTLYSKVQRQF